jgi:hypothetical protein
LSVVSGERAFEIDYAHCAKRATGKLSAERMCGLLIVRVSQGQIFATAKQNRAEQLEERLANGKI